VQCVVAPILHWDAMLCERVYSFEMCATFFVGTAQQAASPRCLDYYSVGCRDVSTWKYLDNFQYFKFDYLFTNDCDIILVHFKAGCLFYLTAYAARKGSLKRTMLKVPLEPT